MRLHSVLAGVIHNFSTAATKPSGVLHRQRSATRKRVPLGLLNVLKSTFAGADPWGTPRAPCQTGVFVAS